MGLQECEQKRWKQLTIFGRQVMEHVYVHRTSLADETEVSVARS